MSVILTADGEGSTVAITPRCWVCTPFTPSGDAGTVVEPEAVSVHRRRMFPAAGRVRHDGLSWIQHSRPCRPISSPTWPRPGISCITAPTMLTGYRARLVRPVGGPGARSGPPHLDRTGRRDRAACPAPRRAGARPGREHGTVGGSVPLRPSLVLVTTALRAMDEIDPLEGTVVVGAGVTCASWRRTRGQRVCTWASTWPRATAPRSAGWPLRTPAARGGRLRDDAPAGAWPDGRAA